MKNTDKLFKKLRINFSIRNPVRALILIYSLIVLAGFLLLSFPCAQKTPTAFIDNLFTAVSAVSTTGLGSVSTSDNYNFFGQFIISLLIQVGGIHYMAFASLIILVRRKKDSKLHEDMVRGDFGLPDDFDVRSFIRSVVIFSFVIEAVAVVPLYFVFQGHGVAYPLWNAVFHSISAFCTAGFSLFNTSFEQFSGNGLLNITIIILSCLGACGFIVVTDYWQKWTRKKKDVTFTTKVIISFTG
ncbi:MAG: potassium transporter TrkG [Candidatus Omnitrophota bacterium]|jgi:trk system potassium uptake protein TrkH